MTQTKQMKIGLCEQVRVNKQTAAFSLSATSASRPIGDILPAPLQPTWTWADMHQMPHRIDDLDARMHTGSELTGKPEVIGLSVGLVSINALVFADAVSLGRKVGFSLKWLSDEATHLRVFRSREQYGSYGFSLGLVPTNALLVSDGLVNTSRLIVTDRPDFDRSGLQTIRQLFSRGNLY